MVRNSQRTLYNIDLGLHQLLGKHYEAIENTTLNEKFQVLPNDKVPVGSYPLLKYYAIGCGGNVNIENVDKYAYSEHLPIDAALFTHIPFIVRNINEGDLSAPERVNYRMRAIRNFNGVNYACYFLKVIPNYELRSMFHMIRTVESGTSVSSPTLSVMSMTDSSILAPVPKTRNITYKNQNNLSFTTKTAKLTFSLTPKEMEELQYSMRIMGLEGKSITEIGLVTGHDIDVGGSKESICSQIAIHMGVSLDLAVELTKGTTLLKSIEIGGGEPYIS